MYTRPLSFIKDYYSDPKAYHRYVDSFPFKQIREEALSRALDFIPQGSEVLEVGCGTGFATKAIAKKAKRVVAIDISAKMIEEARKLELENVEFLKKDFFEITEKYDVVFSFMFLQLFTKPEVVVERMKRLAKRKVICVTLSKGIRIFDFINSRLSGINERFIDPEELEPDHFEVFPKGPLKLLAHLFSFNLALLVFEVKN